MKPGSVTSSSTHHATSKKVYAEVEVWYASGHIVSDETALAIASWYQTAGGHGKVFAQLASTGSCDLEEISEAIAKEIDIQFDTSADSPLLRALQEWCFYQAEEVHRLLADFPSQKFTAYSPRKQDVL